MRAKKNFSHFRCFSEISFRLPLLNKIKKKTFCTNLDKFYCASDISFILPLIQAFWHSKFWRVQFEEEEKKPSCHSKKKTAYLKREKTASAPYAQDKSTFEKKKKKQQLIFKLSSPNAGRSIYTIYTYQLVSQEASYC